MSHIDPLKLARMMMLPPRRYLEEPVVVCPRCKQQVPHYWMMGSPGEDHCGTCEAELARGPLPEAVKAEIRAEVGSEEWLSPTATCVGCGATFNKDPAYWANTCCPECFAKQLENMPDLIAMFEGLFFPHRRKKP